MNQLGAFALPVLLSVILCFGLWKNVGVFDLFLEGAADGLKTLFRIVPSIVGLIVAVQMFKASGALDVLTSALAPVAAWIKMPPEVIPMALLRPISGGGSIALLDRILNGSGADTDVGRIASVMCGSSETTFYTIAVYYGACGITKIRHTIIAALAADAAAAVLSSIIVKLLFPA